MGYTLSRDSLALNCTCEWTDIQIQLEAIGSNGFSPISFAHVRSNPKCLVASLGASPPFWPTLSGIPSQQVPAEWFAAHPLPLLPGQLFSCEEGHGAGLAEPDARPARLRHRRCRHLHRDQFPATKYKSNRIWIVHFFVLQNPKLLDPYRSAEIP